jgi:hypothetical protein
MAAISNSHHDPIKSDQQGMTKTESFFGRKVEQIKTEALDKVHQATTYAKDKICSSANIMKEIAKKVAAYTILFSGFFVLNLGVLASFIVHPIAIPLLVSGATSIAIFSYMKNHEVGLFAKS